MSSTGTRITLAMDCDCSDWKGKEYWRREERSWRKLEKPQLFGFQCRLGPVSDFKFA